MNRCFRLIVLLIIVFAIDTKLSMAASDMEKSLFGSSDSSKSNPLIPKISKYPTDNKQKNTTQPKSTAPKTAKTSAPATDTSSNLPPKTKTAKATKPKTDESLTEKIKQAEENIEDKATEKANSWIKDTWVEDLSHTITDQAKKTQNDTHSSDDSVSLEQLTRENRSINPATGKPRSNAAVFDISGVMLRMPLLQAQTILTNRGFKLVSQKFEIPNFIKWRYEEKCRNSGIIGYERINSCVVKAARDTNHYFVESAKFIKNDSREEINIWLTSNFTNNKVYRITYSTGITNINRGSGQKIKYLHDIKTYEFWRRINQKYGPPDNKAEISWGMGSGKPYLRAITGKLLLEDPMLQQLDYDRMVREDANIINSNMYNF